MVWQCEGYCCAWAVLQIMTGHHKIFPKQFLEDALTSMPGGCHIVLKGTEPQEVLLVAIGYHYNNKTVLHFMMTKDSRSTTTGRRYSAKFRDPFGNLCYREIFCPDCTTKVFKQSNVIDMHNQVCQFQLGLKKSCLTQDPWFCLHTMLVGINVVDTWKLTIFHNVIDGRKVVPIGSYAGFALDSAVPITAFTRILACAADMLAERASVSPCLVNDT